MDGGRVTGVTRYRTPPSTATRLDPSMARHKAFRHRGQRHSQRVDLYFAGHCAGVHSHSAPMLQIERTIQPHRLARLRSWPMASPFEACSGNAPDCGVVTAEGQSDYGGHVPAAPPVV